MVDEFPSNSQTKREDNEEKRVEKVIVGEIIRQKPSLTKRFASTFFGGDAHGVVGYVVLDVLVPAIKDLVVDVISTGIERAVFGEGRAPSRRSGYRPGGSSGYTQYNRFSSPTHREEPRGREVARQSRATHTFDDIILATRAEAQEVINRLFDLVGQYGEATVYDFFELVGVTGNYTDRKWGWTDMRGATVTRVRDGYLVDLPRTEPLKS
jgi:hypothetical protein